MDFVFVLLPLVLMGITFTAFVKLAALLYRRTNLSWTHAFVFFVLVMFVSAIVATVSQVVGQLIPLVVVFPVGWAAQLAMGGWYLGPRAKTADGQPLAFKRGMLLALAFLGLLFAFVAIATVAMPGLRDVARF